MMMSRRFGIVFAALLLWVVLWPLATALWNQDWGDVAYGAPATALMVMLFWRLWKLLERTS